jgi:hypothetical protein
MEQLPCVRLDANIFHLTDSYLLSGPDIQDFSCVHKRLKRLRGKAESPGLFTPID